MMNTQSFAVRPGAAQVQTLRAGQVVPLGSAGGRLEVLHGRVWLTREGDLDDHVVATGESFRVPANGRTLVEAWDDEEPALVAWRPGTLVDRVSAFVGAAVFGPLSDAPTKALAPSALLHNTAATGSRASADAHDREGTPLDAGAAIPGRARFTAQEARRHAAGAA